MEQSKNDLMFWVLIGFLLLVFLSCNEPTKKKEKSEPLINIKSKKKAKYKEGDIVYLKPDSLRGVIADVGIDYESLFTKDSADVRYDILLNGGQSLEGVKEGLIYESITIKEDEITY